MTGSSPRPSVGGEVFFEDLSVMAMSSPETSVQSRKVHTMGPKQIRRVLVLLSVLALAAPVAAFGQGRASSDRKPFSQWMTTETPPTGEEQQSLAAPKENVLLYNVPTSLEGPIDPETYILGPSDELSLIIRGPETTFHQLRVLPEGYVILPNVGPYNAAGVTLARLRADVREALKRFYRNVEIDLLLTKPRNFVVYVSGEVARPGAVELTAPSRVSHAIAAAGGVTETGSVRLIEVRENGHTVSVVDLFLFVEDGDNTRNPMLKEGQTVHVSPRYMKAVTVGELRKPGIFEIVPGETVEDLIRFSGGFSTAADTLHLLVERTNPGKEVMSIVLRSDSAVSIELKDLDVLVVPDLVSLYGIEPVEVLGGGGRDGAFQVATSEKLKDFLFRLWRFTYRYNVESAVIERYVAKGEPEYIYFNVREVLEGGAAGDTILRPGDTISFPVREKQVFVTGEVNLPGAFPFQPGYSAERYIALAGGPNSSGTYDKLDIFALNGSQRDGDRRSLVYRGETIVVKQRTSKILADWFFGMATIAGLALSIYAVTQ